MRKLSSKSAAALRKGTLPQIHQPSAVFCSNRGCTNAASVRLTLDDWAHEHLCMPCFKREYPMLAGWFE